MRIGVIIHPTPRPLPARDLADYARRIEASGFPGIWVAIRWAAVGRPSTRSASLPRSPR